MYNSTMHQDNLGFRSWTWEINHFGTRQLQYQRGFKSLDCFGACYCCWPEVQG